MGFEPTIPASERSQTYALDRAATGTGIYLTLIRLTSTAARNVTNSSWTHYPNKCLCQILVRILR